MQPFSPDTNSVFQLLSDKLVVQQFDGLLYEHTAVRFQLRLRISLVDQAVFFTNDYVSPVKRKYAFHWQNADDSWLMRLDNAPHFPTLATFPHHLHDYQSTSETISDSDNITLTKILDYISQHLNQPTVS